MKEFKYVITDKEGIHARPAGELIKVVKDCQRRQRSRLQENVRCYGSWR